MGPTRSEENTPPSTQGSPAGSGKLSARRFIYGFTRTGLKAKKSLLGLFNSAQSSPAVQRSSKLPTRNVSTPDLPTELERRNTISSLDERRLVPIATLTSSTRFSLWTNTLRHTSSRRLGYSIDDTVDHDVRPHTPLDRSNFTPTPDLFPATPSMPPSVTLDQSEWGDFGSLLKIGNELAAEIPRSSPIVVPSTLRSTARNETPLPSRLAAKGFIVGSMPPDPSPFDDLIANEQSPESNVSRSDRLTISFSGSPMRFAPDPMPTPMPGTTMAMDEAYDPIPPAYDDLYPGSARPFPSTNSCVVPNASDPRSDILGRTGEALGRLRKELNGLESKGQSACAQVSGRPHADQQLHTSSGHTRDRQIHTHPSFSTTTIQGAAAGPKEELETLGADKKQIHKDVIKVHDMIDEQSINQDTKESPQRWSERCASRLTQRSSNWGESGLIPEYIHQARDHFGISDDSPRSASAAKHRRRLMRSKSLTDHERPSDASRSHASSHVSVSHLESLKDLYLSSIDPRVTEGLSWYGFDSKEPLKRPAVDDQAEGHEKGTPDEPSASNESPQSKSYYTDDPVLYDLMARIGTTVEDLAEVDLIHRLLVKARRKQKLRKALKGLSCPTPVSPPKIRRDRHSLPARFKGWFSRSSSKSGRTNEEATDEMICEIEARLYGRKSNKSLDSISDESEVTVTAELEMHQKTVLGIRGGGGVESHEDPSKNPYGPKQEGMRASKSMPHDLHKTSWDGEANVVHEDKNSSTTALGSTKANTSVNSTVTTQAVSKTSPTTSTRLSDEHQVQNSPQQKSEGPILASVEIPAMPFTTTDDDDCYSRNSLGDTIRTALASDSENSSMDEAISSDHDSMSKQTPADDARTPSDDDKLSTKSRSRSINSKFQTRSPTPPAHVLFRKISQKDNSLTGPTSPRSRSPPVDVLGSSRESARSDASDSDNDESEADLTVRVVDVASDVNRDIIDEEIDE